MNVAEYVFERLSARGVRDVFIVTGGGIMYLVDALGRNEKIRHWCNFHEQACAIAAESYSRVTGDLGVCLVTTGPGSANALSALAGAWLDSIPVVVISGQVRTGLIADYSKFRQIGPQEINVIDMARPVTKYAKTLMNADQVPQELERAIQIATSGRPGPVWLNIPLDVQSATIDASQALTAPFALLPNTSGSVEAEEAGIARIVEMLLGSKRPLIVCGNGIHVAHAETEFRAFARLVGCPVVATIGGMDLLAEEDAQYLGRFGPNGQRRANFTIQSADLLLCMATSMSVGEVGFDTKDFAPHAHRVMVNIEALEMQKPHFPVDLAVVADVKRFMSRFVNEVPSASIPINQSWLDASAWVKREYPIVTSDYFADTEHVNPYVLAAKLSEAMGPDEVVVTGNGTDVVSIHHSFAVKPGQRVIAPYNLGAMGWDLPAAVGACIARGGARTVLVTGDGSLELNVQELLTIGHNRLDVKVFVLNNGGYESIRATQNNFFDGRFFGCHAESGVANPKFDLLAAAYGLEYRSIRTNADLEVGIREVLAIDGPCLCELNVSFTGEKSPRIRNRQLEDGTLDSPPLDDQWPFLPRERRAETLALLKGKSHIPAREAEHLAD